MLTLLNWFSQIGAVTKFGLMSVPQRRGSVAATGETFVATRTAVLLR